MIPIHQKYLRSMKYRKVIVIFKNKMHIILVLKLIMIFSRFVTSYSGFGLCVYSVMIFEHIFCFPIFLRVATFILMATKLASNWNCAKTTLFVDPCYLYFCCLGSKEVVECEMLYSVSSVGKSRSNDTWIILWMSLMTCSCTTS